MKKISISIASSCPEVLRNNLISLLGKKFEVVVDDETPQYIFGSVNFYTTKEEAAWVLKHNNAVKIMFTGEAVFPDFNMFDYVICYDDNLICDDRVLRIPILEFDNFVDGFVYDNFDNKNYQKKEKFCNFLYSNSMAHPNRDKFFHLLSKYKKVDSAGMHLRNIDWEFSNQTYGFKEHWRQNSINFKSQYKFSIAFENATYKGYTTEKLLTSMQAGTIPIYWGNPNVGRELNTKSFINCHEYESFEDVIKKVQELDENDDAYKEMYAQPWRTAEQIELCSKETKLFYDRFFDIFDKDYTTAKRHHEGCWQEMYKDALRQRISDKEIIRDNVVRHRQYLGGMIKTVDDGYKLKLSILGIKLALK